MSPSAPNDTLEMMVGVIEPAHYVRARQLVERGYKAIVGRFDAAKQNAGIPKGRRLHEEINSGNWSVPPLLDDTAYAQFCSMSGMMYPEDVLRLIWYYLENYCNEKLLMPCIKLDPRTGHAYVVLMR